MLLLAFSLLGCPANDGPIAVPIPTRADTDGPTDTDPVVETGDTGVTVVEPGPPVPSASIVLTHPTGLGNTTYINGVFLSHGTPFLNPAECLFDMGLCVGTLPTALDVGVDLEGHLELRDVQTQLVGPSLRIGPYNVPDYDQVWYWDTDGARPTGMVDLSWSGSDDWPAYHGHGVFPIAEELVGLSPPPYSKHVVPRDGTFDLTWTPGTDPIYLDVTADRVGGTQVRRTYRLEDDGAFSLDIASLGLQPDDRKVLVELARVQHARIDVEGRPVDLISRTEAFYQLEIPDPTRTLVHGAPACDDIPVLGPGRYHGPFPTTIFFGDASCTRFNPLGRDARFAIELQPGEQLVANSYVFHDPYRLLALQDACDTTGCVAGVGAYLGDDTLTHANEGDEPETLYLVVDSSVYAQWFDLDIEIRPIPNPTVFPDTCAADPLGIEGTFTGSLVGMSSGMDGCLAANATGADAVFPVDVPAGGWVRVRVEGQSTAYLVQDCADVGTCFATSTPWLDWLNLSNEHQANTVVLEVPNSIPVPESITVDVQVIEPTLLQAVDTCAELPDAPLLTTGTHHFRGDTLAFEDDLDVADPGPSCIGTRSDGADGLIRVRLEPGERMEAEYVVPDGAGVAYVLEDCSDTRSVVSCDFRTDGWGRKYGPATVSVENPGPDPIERVLVLDNWTERGFAGVFLLRVVID